jgi:hypothetical protein
MTDERDSLLREVDEELRREQMQKLWERYNGLILGGAALIILAVGGYKIMESRRIAAAEAAGAEYSAAMKLSDDNKTSEADKAFNTIAQSGASGYGALAMLQLAGSQVKEGKTAEALANYEALAKSSGADELLKSFATLQAASLRMGEADFTEIENRLTPLSGDSSPFKISARELMGFAAYKAGKLDVARKYLEPLLIDPKATASIQDRVKVVMGEIAKSEVAAKAGAPAAPAATAPAAAPAAPAAAPAPAAESKPAEADKK